MNKEYVRVPCYSCFLSSRFPAGLFQSVWWDHRLYCHEESTDRQIKRVWFCLLQGFCYSWSHLVIQEPCHWWQNCKWCQGTTFYRLKYSQNIACSAVWPACTVGLSLNMCSQGGFVWLMEHLSSGTKSNDTTCAVGGTSCHKTCLLTHLAPEHLVAAG